MHLIRSNSRDCNKAFIISLRDNKISKDFTERCAKSCEDVGQNYEIFYGFDGNSGRIVVPPELKDQQWLNWFKVTTDLISPTQISCFLSHMALWSKCLELDEPIVILEHDAIMVKKYDFHTHYNAICYLGGIEQLEGSMPKPDTYDGPPPMGSECNKRGFFICRAHAYAIDPAVAKNLLSYVLQNGLYTSLDVAIKSDIFNIYQDDFYAYDKPGISTIHKDWRYLKSEI